MAGTISRKTENAAQHCTTSESHLTQPASHAGVCVPSAAAGQAGSAVQVCVIQNYVYPLFLRWLFDCYCDRLCAAPAALCQTIEILDAAAVYSAEQL